MKKFLKHIFSITEKNFKDSNCTIASKKIIYFFGIKITLKRKLNPEMRYLLSKIDNLEKNIKTINKVQQKHFACCQEILWENLSSNYTPIPKINFEVEKCILFKYDNFFGVGNKSGPNLGDNIQTVAVKNIIDKFYPKIEYEYIDRDNLANYSGKKSICIMQGWFSHYVSTTFLPNKSIFPIYIGFHLEPYKEIDILYLLRYVPNYFENKSIGCRDLYTKNIFKNLGIYAYLSRCLTLTLPKIEKNPNAKKIFFVDIYENYLKYIPDYLFANSEKITQRGCDKGLMDSYYVGTSEKFYFEKSASVFEKYKKEAKLVITTCLHCAAPCVAMGIPVVLFCFKDDKTRYSALEGILPIYTLDDLKNNKVNWSPEAPDIEDLKELMIKNVELTIKEQKGENIDKIVLNNLREKIENYNILN